MNNSKVSPIILHMSDISLHTMLDSDRKCISISLHRHVLVRTILQEESGNVFVMSNNALLFKNINTIRETKTTRVIYINESTVNGT